MTQPLRIAFQGERGAFSEEAVFALFGEDVIPVPCRDFHTVGQLVSQNDAEGGVLPVENSVAGSVVGSYDVLAGGALSVVGEVIRPIRHAVLGTPGASLDRVRRVLSHPVALAQCSRFLRAHPEIEAVVVYDTAGAARDVAAGNDASQAAIAGRRAATLYDLHVLADDVQDRADNQTRFVAVIRAGADDHRILPGERRKTMLVAETADRPGALVALLEAFAARSVNLTKIESRPGDSPWSYRFFLELEGDSGEAAVRAALDEAASRSQSLRVLGSFPRLSSP